MNKRIKYLLQLLNKYSIDDINKLYRDKEVELEIASFTKYPDVKWSEPLKKKMIQQAKRKKISPGRQKYITNLITLLNDYPFNQHLKTSQNDLTQLFANLEKSKIDKKSIRIMHIEFSDMHKVATVELYGDFDTHWYENRLGEFSSNFDSADYWKETETDKFYTISELLQDIEIEEEEYLGIFTEIYELRVFNAINSAMNSLPFLKKLKNEFTDIKIEIGHHDDDFHTIYKS